MMISGTVKEQREILRPSEKGGEPKIRLSESDDAVFVVADVPGLGAEDLALHVLEGQELLLQSKKRGHAVPQFSHRVMLPSYADAAKATCRIKKGTLTVTIPKRANRPAKRLTVTPHGSSSIIVRPVVIPAVIRMH